MGGRGSRSSTSASAARLAEVNRAIDEKIDEISSVVDSAKNGLWDTFSEGNGGSYDSELRGLLDDYEPSITEERIVALNRRYGADEDYDTVMEPLVNALPDDMTVDRFYMQWGSFTNLTEERRRLIAGQIAMSL